MKVFVQDDFPDKWLVQDEYVRKCGSAYVRIKVILKRTLRSLIGRKISVWMNDWFYTEFKRLSTTLDLLGPRNEFIADSDTRCSKNISHTYLVSTHIRRLLKDTLQHLSVTVKMQIRLFGNKSVNASLMWRYCKKNWHLRCLCFNKSYYCKFFSYRLSHEKCSCA